MTETNNQSTKGLVPRLRFPSYSTAIEFQALSDVADLVDERIETEAVTRRSYASTENLLPDFGGFAIATSLPTTRTVTRFQPRDILLANIRPYLKKVWRADREGGASNDVLVFRAKEESQADFLATWLRSEAFIRYVMSGAKGVKMPRGDIALIKKFPVPKFGEGSDEQQKIADCLSSLDARIDAETRRLDALKTHKQGLLQQLFPREGETVPRLRFSEFRNAGAWFVGKVEDMAKRGSGHTPNKKEPTYYNGGIGWVSLADSNKLDNGYIYDTCHEISDEGIRNSSAVLHPPETVILSRDAGVGRSAVLHHSMAVSQHFIAWRCDKEKLNNWFFYYFLQVMKPAFESIAVGNTIKTIGLPYFKAMCIAAPQVNEQQKIADCLTSLDDLIAAQGKKIDLLKIHKRGLMQQLFPVLDEAA